MSNLNQITAEAEAALEAHISGRRAPGGAEAGVPTIFAEEIRKFVRPEARAYAATLVDLIRTFGANVTEADGPIALVAIDALERLPSMTREFDELGPNDPLLVRLAREELRTALEDQMSAMRSDDLEAIGKLERLIGSLERAASAAACA